MIITYDQVINWSFANINLAMIILAIPFLLLHLIINFFTHRTSRADIIYRWLSLFGVGFMSLFWFGMHVFLPDYTAHLLGWQNSLFQYCAGIANLAIGIVGIGAFWRNCGFRLANTILFTIWAWGLAIGRIIFMMENYHFVNDTWFWCMTLLPVVLILCMIRICRTTPRVVVVEAP